MKDGTVEIKISYFNDGDKVYVQAVQVKSLDEFKDIPLTYFQDLREHFYKEASKI